jgi:Na+/H+-translocating membrane pyrophosphatase
LSSAWHAGAAGYFGMRTPRANVRTTAAARIGLNPARVASPRHGWVVGRLASWA